MSSQNSQAQIKRRRPLLIAVVILGALGITFLAFSGLYTDVLWFNQLGFGDVFVTNIMARLVTFAIPAVIMAVVTWASLALAYRNRPIYVRSANPNLAQFSDLITQLRKAIMIGVPAVLGLFAGVAVSSSWSTVLLWLNRTYLDKVDPQFGMDVGFYLFGVPFYRVVITFISAMLMLSLLLAVAVHLAFGGIRFTGVRGQLTRPARLQIGLLAAAYFVAQAASIWLDQFSTMTSSSGLYTGATYADVNAAIPGLQILSVIGFVVAALFAFAAFAGKWRLPVLATALMLVSAIVLQGIYPWGVQNFQVGPNERTLEAEYINRNIDATRFAYGLDNVETTSYNAKSTASAADIRKDAESTAQIRIIDPYLVSASFRQLEQYRQYYNFENHLDVDRYKIDGKSQDTVLAVRELQQSGLGSSQSWYNNTLVYTHGYGVVAAYGNQRSADGQPVFLQSGIPSTGKLGTYEPRIYFGENSPPYSIVGGAPDAAQGIELDYPGGKDSAEQTYTTFKGDGGPKLDNIFTRLSYAIKFGSEQILLSNGVTDNSQILYDRDPKSRVEAVAPYLTLDSNPYPAVVDGRVKWIIDGYTTSANYPYSRAENLGDSVADSNTSTLSSFDNINYIRNSVKATVDAYDGSVKLYAWDTTDPILKTWMKVYPNTVSPVSEMSADLLSHIRYPEDLFKMQRTILGQYHVSDAGAFYSQQDAWMTPNDPVGRNGGSSDLQPPYYSTMQVPGDAQPSFSLYSTFIPRSTGASTRNVLTGYLVADSEAGSTAGVKGVSYGKLRLLTLPRDTVVPGPGQVQAMFSADSDVARLLNLLRQGSTNVLNGNLLTLPVGGGLLYVQPVYIKSTGETSFPLLKKVLVAFGDKIAFEDTLTGALDALFAGSTGTGGTGTGGTGTGGTGTGTGGTGTGGTGTSGNTALAAALEQAKQALADKAAAMADNDWTAYGKADAALTKAIDAAIAAQTK